MISILSSFPKEVRFVGIGLINTLTYVLICWTLNAVTALEMRAVNLISYGACMVLSYFAHRKITFRSRNRVRHEIPRFVTLHGINLLLSTVLLYLAGALGIDRYVATLMSGFIIMASSFMVLQAWVFKSGRGGSTPPSGNVPYKS